MGVVKERVVGVGVVVVGLRCHDSCLVVNDLCGVIWVVVVVNLRVVGMDGVDGVDRGSLLRSDLNI